MMKELPLYFHPTEIILVDDDVNYSKNLEMVMLDKDVLIRVFNDPKKALEFIKNKSSVQFSEKLVNIEDQHLDKTIFNIDLNKLHKEIYNKDRFNTVSVIIVDYAMPGLSGKEVFEQIQHLPVQKILLTGEADYEMAVKMFNSGLIDRFFRKNDEDLFEKLFKEIAELKIQFFQKINHSTLAALQKKSPTLPFNDPVFIKFFLETLQKYEIVEYYALDENGSYLLINKSGLPIGLIVKSEEDMRVLCEIAEGEKNISQTILNDLKNKKKLAYFHTPKDMNVPVNSWSLHDAQLLGGGAQPYYYALVKTPELFKLEPTIFSYHQFSKTHS